MHTKTLKITCNTTATLPYRNIRDFQGNLKIRTSQDVNTLKESILQHGFSFPFFVWEHEEDGQSVYDCIDGHGRMQVLSLLQEEGYEIPDLPVVFISASSAEEARTALISANTQVGNFLETGLRDFVREIPDFDITRYTFPDINIASLQQKLDRIQQTERIIQQTEPAAADLPAISGVIISAPKPVPAAKPAAVKSAPEPDILQETKPESVEAQTKKAVIQPPVLTSQVEPTEPVSPKTAKVVCQHCGQTFQHDFW
jgi:hypothetical protein